MLDWLVMYSVSVRDRHTNFCIQCGGFKMEILVGDLRKINFEFMNKCSHLVHLNEITFEMHRTRSKKSLIYLIYSSFRYERKCIP